VVETSTPLPAAEDPPSGGAAESGPQPSSPGPLGPLTGLRILVLVVAVAFLAGAVGWAVGQRDSDPLSDTDVGFLRDMGFHHEQAVELSLIVLYKDDVDPGLQAFAQEVIIGQRFEQGLFNAILSRFGHETAVFPEDEVMGWMGPPMAATDMAGFASEAELQALADADGAQAEALWIALISEHHLGGLHMADHAARHGSDAATVNLARRIVAVQRSEVIDLDRYRRNNGLPIPDGYPDPLEDQRLDPLSISED
jgi:uncharacterized protein (DUF305 family)